MPLTDTAIRNCKPGSTMDIPKRYRMTGESPAFVQFWKTVQRFAQQDAIVLICGETGVGKELTARALHYLGRRASGPFLPINCGAIPDSLFESEFFGFKRGAFTDARASQIGLIEQARGGTLFLDEIETLSYRGQAALLRFLQDYHYRPLGARGEELADVRVLAATNVDLASLTSEKLFRPDLMHRLKALVLEVPPLRARRDDIELIAEALLNRWSADAKIPPKGLTFSAMRWLRDRDWPGNVRELEHVLLNGFIAADGQEIDEMHFGANASEEAGPKKQTGVDAYIVAKRRALETFERSYLMQLMREAGGNITKAAAMSRQHRTALSKMLKKHGVSRARIDVRANSDAQP